MTPYRIRPASALDAATILRFIRELADYEKALDAVEATEETIASSLFGEGSVTRAVICETAVGEPAGSAIFFKSYSTWQAKNGLYLEDLYVTPAHRGAGVGKMLLRHLARINRQCFREVTLQVVGKSEVVIDVGVQRADRCVARVRLAVGLDYIRLALHQLRSFLEIVDRVVELAHRDVAVAAVAVEPRIVRV